MSFKDILVHVDSSVHCRPRLELAASLAADHGAHLTGLGVRMIPHVPRFIMSQLGPEIADAQQRAASESVAAERKLFDDVMARAGIAHEWRTVEGDLIDCFCVHGRYADLIVAGQVDPRDDAMDGEHGLADQVVMEAGRPVLVVPYAGTFKTLGTHAVVAWNGSREATRAVNDALPLLRKSRKVDVLVINPHGGRLGHGDVPGADICVHLARQGVKAEAHALHADDMEVGDTLLSRVTDEGADLLVMGAYGRSRMRTMILGGVTRHILRHMTVPVLMSH